MKEKYIRERESSYQVAIKYEDISGTRHEYNKSFKFKDYKSKHECLKAACKHRDETLYRLQFAPLQFQKDKTLSEVYQESKELFPHTIETDRKHDSIFKPVLECFGNRTIKSLTAKEIARTLNDSIGKSQDQINRLFSIWKYVYKCALISDYVVQDPTVKVIVPKSEKIITPKSVVMECTLENVLNALADYGYSESTIYDCKLLSYAMIIMACLGVRPAECYALTRSDFDLDNKTVSINKSVGSTHTEKNTIRKTKTHSSIRSIPLPDELIPFIEELFSFTDNDQLFTFFDGKLVYSQKAASLIKCACDKAGIRFNSYMLRHAFSTNMLQQGVDIRTIMELMGHTSSSMSLEYARSNNDLKKDAINSIVGKAVGRK